MSILLPVVFVLGCLVIVAIIVLAGTLISVVNRTTEINKQLLLVIAGKEDKPETLRALVAQDRQPSKPLAGVAAGIVKGKKEEKSKNQDYIISVGGK